MYKILYGWIIDPLLDENGSQVKIESGEGLFKASRRDREIVSTEKTLDELIHLIAERDLRE